MERDVIRVCVSTADGLVVVKSILHRYTQLYMETPCKYCVFNGDNPIRCEDCKREGDLYYHFKGDVPVISEEKPVEKKRKKRSK